MLISKKFTYTYSVLKETDKLCNPPCTSLSGVRNQEGIFLQLYWSKFLEQNIYVEANLYAWLRFVFSSSLFVNFFSSTLVEKFLLQPVDVNIILQLYVGTYIFSSLRVYSF